MEKSVILATDSKQAAIEENEINIGLRLICLTSNALNLYFPIK